MPENEIDQDTLQRIRDAQQLGFVTALDGAGVEPEDIHRLYSVYEEQRGAREHTLEETYKALINP